MKLNPASYAVLGQLAFRPWAAYELIKEMRRNFHYFYPRAESGLYEELKKLEQMGLARSEKKEKGKAERTIYNITTTGRAALRAWLETPPDLYRLEFEGLLRLFLAKFGDRSMLQQSLGKVRTDADELFDLAERIGNEYLRGEAPGQAEIVERVCIFDFLLHCSLLFRHWLDRTEAYLNIVDNLSSDEAETMAKSIFQKLMEENGMKTA